MFLHRSPVSRFDLCEACAENNLRGRGLSLTNWRYLFFSERGVAGKLLIMPFQPSCPLDEHHAFGLNSQSSSFYHKSDQPEID